MTTDTQPAPAASRSQRRMWWDRFPALPNQDLPDVQSVLEATDMAFNAEIRPIAVMAADGWKHNEQWDNYAVVRDDTDELLGLVKSRYRVVQHRDALAFVDTIITDHGAKIEAAWSSHNGSKFKLAVKLPEMHSISNGDDELFTHMLFSTSHDGTESVKMGVVNVQLSCLNQISPLLASKAQHKVVHSSLSADKLAEASLIVQTALDMTRDTVDLLDSLTTAPISEDACRIIVNRAVTRTCGHGSRRGNEDASGIMAILRESPTMPASFRGTRMGLAHAVTEYYDHCRRYRTPEAQERENLYGITRKVRDNVFAELAA